MTSNINQLLVEAASEGNDNEVKRLIIEGANPKWNASEALLRAVEHNYAETVQLLIEQGADPNCRKGLCVTWAAHPKKIEVLRKLFEYPIDIMTPMYVRATEDALYLNSIEGCQLLLQKQGKNILTKVRRRALTEMIERNATNTLSYIVNDLPEKTLKSLLTTCMRLKNRDCTKIILDTGVLTPLRGKIPAELEDLFLSYRSKAQLTVDIHAKKPSSFSDLSL